MLGNFATGVSILAPAGMLTVLADGLGVGIRDTGLLVTFGAVILCFGSPIVAWLTTRVDRRLLLTGTLAVLVAGQAASALAPNYATVLALRLAMLAVAAIYTPQAASTVAMIVPQGRRSSAIAFVFLGWSLAVAGGLPMIAFVAAYAGWRAAFAAAALAALVPCLLLAFTLPGGLRGPPLSLNSFGVIARHRKILLLLLITILQTSGQFTVFIYLAPLLMRLTGAGHNAVGAMFAIYGVAGFAGNVIATRIVSALGGWVTSVVFLGSTFTGMLLWALGAGCLAGDGHRHRVLGARLCRHQLHAAGAPGDGGARSVERDGRAQHLGALHRAGDRLGDRRRIVQPRLSAQRRLRRRRLCGARHCGLGDHPRRPNRARRESALAMRRRARSASRPAAACARPRWHSLARCNARYRARGICPAADPIARRPTSSARATSSSFRLPRPITSTSIWRARKARMISVSRARTVFMRRALAQIVGAEFDDGDVGAGRDRLVEMQQRVERRCRH